MDLKDAAEVAELYHLMQAHTGGTPTLTPVLSGEEAAVAVPAAIQRARS